MQKEEESTDTGDESGGREGGGGMAGIEVAVEDACFYTMLYAHPSSSIHPV